MTSGIALNAILFTPKLGGMGVYLKNLINGLKQHDHAWDAYVFAAREMVPLLEHENANFVPIDFFDKHPLKRVIKEMFGWPKVLNGKDISLFHSPGEYIPLGIEVPAIVTAHDLRFAHFPKTYTKLRAAFLNSRVPHSLGQARAIIAVSEFTKTDMCQLYGIDPAKIHVIHEGIDAHYFQQKHHSPEQVLKRYALMTPYILAVGHLEPRKNYIRLIKALKILRDEKTIDHKLLIVGQENWYFEEIYNSVHTLDMDDRVIFSGFVPENDLPSLYQNADLFVAPSTFEGFGFTPLEAMAADVPVCVSNITSHPEICGAAAAYFDPFEIDDIARAIYHVLSDTNTRQNLVEKGRQNVKRFTWRECCEKTFNLYDKILNDL